MCNRQITPIQGLSPRVRGNLLGAIVLLGIVLGLSPRVRGNLSKLDFHKDYYGSIPACAGEPSSLRLIR